MLLKDAPAGSKVVVTFPGRGYYGYGVYAEELIGFPAEKYNSSWKNFKSEDLRGRRGTVLVSMVHPTIFVDLYLIQVDGVEAPLIINRNGVEVESIPEQPASPSKGKTVSMDLYQEAPTREELMRELATIKAELWSARDHLRRIAGLTKF